MSWFSEKATDILDDFLERWPSAEQAKAARTDTLRSFFIQHNVRGVTRIDERIQAIKSSVALTDDTGVVGPCTLRVSVLLRQLRALLRAIEQYDL